MTSVPMTQPRVRRGRSRAAPPVGWDGCDPAGGRVRRAGPDLPIRLATLAADMETMFPARRRSLPPVPPPASGPASGRPHEAAARDADEEPGQTFVARLRAAAPEFAAAGGAQSAVVPE